MARVLCQGGFPASATRRAAALRGPWVTQRSGGPASAILPATKFPNPFDVKEIPNEVASIRSPHCDQEAKAAS